MSARSLDEELSAILEDQYEDGPEVEESYVVTFTDGTQDDKFSLEDYELLYNNEHIADLQDPEDKMEIGDKIRTYCELELNKEIEDIEDGIGQSLLEEAKIPAKLDQAAEAVANKIKELYKDDPDLLEYFVIEPEVREHYYDDGSDMHLIQVRGELSYNQMVNLAKKLDEVVQQFDKDAYFDQVEPGIMDAVIRIGKPVQETEIESVGDRVAKSARYARAALDDILLDADLNQDQKILIEDVKELLRNMIPELQ